MMFVPAGTLNIVPGSRLMTGITRLHCGFRLASHFGGNHFEMLHIVTGRRLMTLITITWLTRRMNKRRQWPLNCTVALHAIFPKQLKMTIIVAMALWTKYFIWELSALRDAVPQVLRWLSAPTALLTPFDQLPPESFWPYTSPVLLSLFLPVSLLKLSKKVTFNRVWLNIAAPIVKQRGKEEEEGMAERGWVRERKSKRIGMEERGGALFTVPYKKTPAKRSLGEGAFPKSLGNVFWYQPMLKCGKQRGGQLDRCVA